MPPIIPPRGRPNTTRTPGNQGGTGQAFVAPVGAPVPVLPSTGAAPGLSSNVYITGTPKVGNVLTANDGNFTGSPTPTKTLQWYYADDVNNPVAISGATGQTYTVASGDAPHPFLVRQTATNASGSVVSTSAPTATSYAQVTISGTPATTATAGGSYLFTPTTANGSGTKSFALTGTLPTGWTFSTTTGAVAQNASQYVGSISGLSVTVTDNSGSATLTIPTINVSGAVVPGQVTGLTSPSQTATALSLSWAAPSSGDPPTTYIAQYRVTGSGSTFTPVDFGSTLMSGTISGLTMNTSYDVQVAAKNSGGTGPFSTLLTVSTAATANTNSPFATAYFLQFAA